MSIVYLSELLTFNLESTGFITLLIIKVICISYMISFKNSIILSVKSSVSIANLTFRVYHPRFLSRYLVYWEYRTF